MLEDLKILNGKLSLKFDTYNTKYTITLNDSKDTELELEYLLKEGCNVEIEGNYLDKNYNEVTLKVFNETESETYYLYVYKNEEEEASKTVMSMTNLEEIKEEISPYAAPGIATTCFLLILFLFTFLFRKKKSVKISKRNPENCKVDTNLK